MEFPVLDLYGGPPDLLKRFVATPFQAKFRFGQAEVLAETNDSHILHVLRQFEIPFPIPPELFHWKLVREQDVRVQASEPMLLKTGPLAVVSMGPPCLAAFDYEKNELLAFFGFAATDEILKACIIQLLREFAASAAAGERQESAARISVIVDS